MLKRILNKLYVNYWDLSKKIRRFRLKNHTMSVISINCNGAMMLHDLKIRFNSPFVNLWLYPSHFLEFLENIDVYERMELCFIEEKGINYPIGKLGDIKIYFQHYKNKEEAKAKWEERMKRLNKDNLFIMMTDRDGCTYEDLLRFDNLSYKNKVVFTHKPYPEIKSAFYIKGFENKKEVGILQEFDKYHQRFYDQFDYVKWFNQGLNKNK